MFEQSHTLFQSVENNDLNTLKKHKISSDLLSQPVKVGLFEIPKKLNLLEAAAYLGNYGSVVYLQNYIDPTINDNLTFRIACERGHYDIVELLLKNENIHPGSHDNEAICITAKNGHAKIFILLLNDNRVNPAVRHNAPFRYAAENDHDDILKLLLQREDCDPSDLADIALRTAAAKDKVKSISTLMSDARVNPTSYNNGAIKEALKNENYKSAILLYHNITNKNGIKYNKLETKLINKIAKLLRIKKYQDFKTKYISYCAGNTAKFVKLPYEIINSILSYSYTNNDNKSTLTENEILYNSKNTTRPKL